jgi:hypothetical protein
LVTEKFNDLIGIGTCDLPVCSIVPQPSTLPRASGYTVYMSKICTNIMSTTDASTLSLSGQAVPSVYQSLTRQRQAPNNRHVSTRAHFVLQGGSKAIIVIFGGDTFSSVVLEDSMEYRSPNMYLGDSQFKSASVTHLPHSFL